MPLIRSVEAVEKYLRDSGAEINDFGSALPGYVNPNIKLQIKFSKHELIIGVRPL